VAHHITEVLPDRYYGITTMWSLKQQAIVADCRGYVVFFNFDTGKIADLVKADGAYKELYNALTQRKDREAAIAAKWENERSKKAKASL
jgi:hypothetical protein